METRKCVNRFVGIRWAAQTLLTPNWSWSSFLQVSVRFHDYLLVCRLFFHIFQFLEQVAAITINHFLPLFLSRSEGFNDGCDVGCSHVLSHLHIQQFQHHFHHGPLEEHPPHCLRVGAHDCGKV